MHLYTVVHYYFILVVDVFFVCLMYIYLKTYPQKKICSKILDSSFLELADGA